MKQPCGKCKHDVYSLCSACHHCIKEYFENGSWPRFEEKKTPIGTCTKVDGDFVEFEFKNEEPKQQLSTPALIVKTCHNLMAFLLEKNKNYGDSAISPLSIFSKSDADLIDVRIDDKLSRIKNSKELRKNDVVDLVGYLILKLVKKGWTTFDDKETEE